MVVFTLVPRAAASRGLHAGRAHYSGAMATDADCLFCKIVARDIPADVVHETDDHRRLPRPRAAGADPRAGDPAPPRAGRRRARRRRARRARRPRRRRGGGRRRRRASARATGWSSTPARPRTRPSSTPTCTCSAAARWAGRPDEPPRLLRTAAAVAACWRSPRRLLQHRERHRQGRRKQPTSSAAGHRPPRRRDRGHGSWPKPVAAKPLRAGERLVRLAMPTPYTPSAPYGTGTDDYRCFVLDPHLAKDAFITGLNILPGQPKVVHHVILFRVPPSGRRPWRPRTAPKGRGLDLLRRHRRGGQRGARQRALAGGLGARRVRAGAGQGRRRPAGQGLADDHAGALQPARRAAPGRLARPSCGWRRRPSSWPPLETVLLPAPVELPCRPAGTADGSATAPPPSPTPSAASGTRSGWPRTTCTCCAASCSRARCRPATGRCRRRRRSGPPPATCTCWAAPSRSR